MSTPRNIEGPAGVVLALSGPVCAGKTTLAQGLAVDLRAQILSTRDILNRQAGGGDRRSLQQLGEELDSREGAAWVCRPALWARAELDKDHPLIIDAVRTADQVSALRDGMWVVHLHLTAVAAVLEQRYEQRQAREPDFELVTYESVRADPTELAADDLAGLADLVLETDVLSMDETRAKAELSLG